MGKRDFKVTAPKGVARPVVTPKTDDEPNVAVSLRYWHTGSECISVWQRTELERLRKLIDKIQGLTATKVRLDHGLEHKLHKAAPKRGFTRPSGLSKDIPMCELRVTSKARVHGALHNDIFYLVWLDRNHDVFPSGK